MSATMTAPEQIDGLEKLITLASLRKEDIIATQTELRKQIQLTQDEQAKIAEAKSYISQHASLAAALQRSGEELTESKKLHDAAVEKHAAHVAAENSRLEAFSAALSAREAEIAKREKALPEREGNLQAAVAEHERQNNEAVNKNIADAAANERARKANEAENDRLLQWETSLKARAERLRKEAASF